MSTYPSNLAKGQNALQNISSDASNNIAFGNNAGSTIVNGNNNTFIGANTNINSSSNNFSNSTAIGYGATIDASNQIMLGTANQNVVVPGTLTGAGVTLPSFKVSITNNSITSVSPYNYVPIPYNVIDYDYNLGGSSGSNFDISTYIYTVPLSGKYEITFNFVLSDTVAASNYAYGSFISINNTTLYPGNPTGQLYLCDDRYSNNLSIPYSKGSIILTLTQGDKVSVLGFFKTYTLLTFNNTTGFPFSYTSLVGNCNWFSGSMVSY